MNRKSFFRNVIIVIIAIMMGVSACQEETNMQQEDFLILSEVEFIAWLDNIFEKSHSSDVIYITPLKNGFFRIENSNKSTTPRLKNGNEPIYPGWSYVGYAVSALDLALMQKFVLDQYGLVQTRLAVEYDSNGEPTGAVWFYYQPF